MLVSIIVSIIALIISILAYFKQPDEITIEREFPNWEYTDNGIQFYDKTGKKILIQGEK